MKFKFRRWFEGFYLSVETEMFCVGFKGRWKCFLDFDWFCWEGDIISCQVGPFVAEICL